MYNHACQYKSKITLEFQDEILEDDYQNQCDKVLYTDNMLISSINIIVSVLIFAFCIYLYIIDNNLLTYFKIFGKEQSLSETGRKEVFIKSV